MVIDITPEEIAQKYSATMDSVDLINQLKPEMMSDEEWLDCIERNKQHIRIMLEKNFWTTEDLTPFEDAVK